MLSLSNFLSFGLSHRSTWVFPLFSTQKGQRALRDGGIHTSRIHSLQRRTETRVSPALPSPQTRSAFSCPAGTAGSRTGSGAMNALRRSCFRAASTITLSEKSVKANQTDVILSVLLLPRACSRFAAHFSSRKSYAALAVHYIKAYMPLVSQFCSAESFRLAGSSFTVGPAVIPPHSQYCTSKTSGTSEGDTAVLCFRRSLTAFLAF